METIYLDFRNHENGEKKDLTKAVEALQNGELVIMPTETVYGLGADGLQSKAVRKIFEAKGRKQDNPLILHVADRNMIDQVAVVTSQMEEKLIQAFMPGPLTIILQKKECVPDEVTAGNDTVGIRMPSDEIAHQLIQELGRPIAAPSANLSGKPSGTLMEDIDQGLKQKVAVLIDGGQSRIGLESTVVKVIDGIPTILRPGRVTLEEIQKVCGKGEIDSHIFQQIQKQDEKVESPGMKYRHYAPKTKCRMIYSQDPVWMVQGMKSEIQKANQEGKKILVLALSEDLEKYQTEKIEDILDMGKRENLEEVSNRIFTLLRKVDHYGADLVLIEGVRKEGLGLAIMNRLIRACEYDYREIEKREE